MLKLKDLKNRVYENKICTEFEYTLLGDEGKKLFKANFSAIAYRDDKPIGWNMLIVLPNTKDSDSQVYHFDYVLPNTNLPLETIAATGLTYFQLFLREEMESKININFSLGSVLKGM